MLAPLSGAIASEVSLSEFNGTGFNYTFDNFTQTIGPSSVRLSDPTNGWGGAGLSLGGLDLSGFSEGRFVVGLTPQAGNGVSRFDLELIEQTAPGEPQKSGKWTFSLDGLTPGTPATLTSATVLSQPTGGLGDYQNLDLSRIATWQVLGDFGSPAPFDISFDRVAISTVAPAPPPYAGAEPDAPWRAQAAAQIDAVRKAELTVMVRDASGAPVPGAEVHVAMQQHEFGFGSAVQAFRLRDNAPQHAQYKARVAQLFNVATLENNLKWPAWEGEWGGQWSQQGALNALDWLAAQGIEGRGHVMVWPGTDNLPADIRQLLADDDLTPAEQAIVRGRIASHIAAVGAATDGKVVAWDVINETRTNTDLVRELDEGAAAMVTWFQQARAAAPDADLYINDYGILNSGGGSNRQIYRDTIAALQSAGAPIDGIGFQGHFSEGDLAGPEQLWAVLDQFASLGLRMQVTEFDINTTDEQLQADYTRDFLTAAFAHEGLDDVIMWGFWEGAHWRPDAAMYRNDWTIKPNGQAYLDLVFGEWWTDAQQQTSVDGATQLRGFKGDYELTATYHGASAVEGAVLTGDSLTAVVTLPVLVGDYNADGGVDAADYAVWRDSLGSTTQLAADGDNNGVVDQSDYLVWKSRFGATVPAAVGATVPEPSSGVAVAISTLAWITLSLRRTVRWRP